MTLVVGSVSIVALILAVLKTLVEIAVDERSTVAFATASRRRPGRR